MDDNFTYDLCDVGPSLGSPTPLFLTSLPGGYLLVTLNCPRTKTFINSTSVKQKIGYTKLFNYIKSAFNMFDVIDSGYVFEHCEKGGHIHLHGYLQFSAESFHCPIGLVNDAVKTYLSKLPKKYSMFSERSFFLKYMRYKGPSVCVQYLYNSDTSGFERWKTYMNKQQGEHPV